VPGFLPGSLPRPCRLTRLRCGSPEAGTRAAASLGPTTSGPVCAAASNPVGMSVWCVSSPSTSRVPSRPRAHGI